MNVWFKYRVAIAAIGCLGVAISAGQCGAASRAVKLREELNIQPQAIHWNAQWISAPLPSHNPLQRLSWMWGNTGGGGATPSHVWVRRQIKLPTNVIIRSAVFQLTADEQFVLYVNGVHAAQTTQWRGANWNTIYHPNITRLLHGGVNTLAIAATNVGDNINHAGLIGRLTVILASGVKVYLPIDTTWLATNHQPAAGWENVGFNTSGWKHARAIARWGRGPWGHRPSPRQALPLFRHSFAIKNRIRRATVYVSGLGQYTLFINGRKVGDDVMQPGWTDYTKTVLYNAYNVAPMLRRGHNAIGVMLGTGMYDCPEGTRRYEHSPNPFGRPKLILQMHITFIDGTSENIVSNGQWRTNPGPVTFSSIYGGEDYNALEAIPGWDQIEFNDSQWRQAMVVNGPGGKLTPQIAPPVKVMHIYKPVRITHPQPGVSVYDLGQNMAGRFIIQARGPAGSKLVVYPSELLHPNGTQWQSCAGPIWCVYTLDGKGVETFHPFFSYFGFRYVQIDALAADKSGVDNRPVVLRVVGQATHTSSPAIGHFSCSNSLLNHIHHIITMAMVNNMVSIITDCPTREKTGWLEDTYLVGPGIMDNYFVPKLYEQTAANMRDAQWPNGMVPDFAPEYFNYPGAFTNSPEWGSACVMDPWLTYQYFGDKRILSQNYQMMIRYVHYLKTRARNHIVAFGLGDWFDLGPGAPGFEQLTSMGVTATATWYRDLTTLVEISRILGHPQAARQFAAESRDVRAAFNRRFYHPSTGQYDRGSQCANAMALATGLVQTVNRNKVLHNLIANIVKHKYHTTAGDIGFHYVVQALTNAGQSELLYKMATQTTPPSYGYQIAHGATALTEAWNCNAGDSQDHFMLGHIEQWFFNGLGGIQIDMARKPGRQLEIRPAIVGNLRWVHVSYDSVLGKIVSNWQRTGPRVILRFTIPPNTEARVVVPTTDPQTLQINQHVLPDAGVRIVSTLHDEVSFEVPSGHYVCVCQYNRKRQQQ
ncbi:MAG: family 78 glycoside hydrolase catalytic domain [Phycisphaerae bacterium]